MKCSLFARAAACAAMMLIVSSARANAPEGSPVQLNACIKKQIAGAQAQGWRMRGADGDKAAGQPLHYQLTLYKGSRYLFTGCVHSAAAKMRLAIYDDAGAMVASHPLPSDAPLIEVSPSKTGAYVLRVVLESASPQEFSLGFLYR